MWVKGRKEYASNNVNKNIIQILPYSLFAFSALLHIFATDLKTKEGDTRLSPCYFTICRILL